ncbi:MAG: 30S ribosomal protein S9 [Patescibacteria group bacterium]|jgi:small subunit ribosomal protein S9
MAPTTVKHVKAAPKAKPAAVSGDHQGFIRAVGRRKSAIARVRLYLKGKGDITINGKKLSVYFPQQLLQDTILEPLPLVGLGDAVDVTVKVVGGGIMGQAEAIRLGLVRALVEHNIEWRPTMRKMGWLTRDARVKERKKPGLKRARRAPQWQKR